MPLTEYSVTDMQEILKAVAVAVITCVACVTVKQYRPEYAALTQLCAVAVIAAAAVRTAEGILQEMTALAELSDTGEDCIKILIKALAVAVIAQTAGDLCRDSGNSALAGITEFAGKAAIIAFAIPLIRSVAVLAIELINI